VSNNDAYGAHIENSTAAFGGAAFVYQLDMVDSTVTGNVAAPRAHSGRHQLRYRRRHRHDPRRARGWIDDRFEPSHTTSAAAWRRSETCTSATARFQATWPRHSARRRLRSLSGEARGLQQHDHRQFRPKGAGIFLTTDNATLQSTIVAGNFASDATEIGNAHVRRSTGE